MVLLADGRLAVRDAPPGSAVLDLRSPADLVGFVQATHPLGDIMGGHGAGGVDAPEGAPLLLFLGGDPAPGGQAYLALVLPEAPRGPVDSEGVAESLSVPAEGSWATLREVGHLLDPRDAGLAVTAVGLAAWHRLHPRCPRCGAPTLPAEGGWTRRCTADGSDHYPRTDPAVIMAVLDSDDRLLLGHGGQWPEGRFSTLAGYVEPGESLETAVRREVAEEVGVQVGQVTYRGSQPWPFPASLMLAFIARATTTDIVVDGVEITQARWFSRKDLATAVRAGDVQLPGPTSVARALIEDWFGGPLPSRDQPPA